MRELLLLVADKNMQSVFRALFGRDDWPDVLGCAPFEFDARQDLIYAAGQNDPGIVKRGQEIVRSYLRTHQRVLVVLDEAWSGSPGKEEIERRVSTNLRRNGWSGDRSAALAIQPEVDVWIWIDDPVVEQQLGFDDREAMRTCVTDAGLMGEEDAKPAAPKEAAELCCRTNRKPRSSALYGRIVARADVHRCTDPSFRQLQEIVRGWFPRP